MTKIRTPLLESGLSPSTIAIRIDKIDDAEEGDQKEAWSWLIGFQNVYVKDYVQAREAIPEQVRVIYRNLEVRGTGEQKELFFRKRLMWKEWKNRPFLLTRKLHDPGRKNIKVGRNRK